MRNNLKHRTLLERGGLMIEALAMLGLIAVVTPTMYKKSAERTMEVDDINTATTIRSYVSAAEAYMATNYVPLMKGFEDEISEGATPPAQQYKVITNNDLADFLPYKFKSASSLYDYNEPKITVVKNANNLTAFLLFPAKGAGENGLGQERTARIASLVGANGGYVRSEHNARGIGGIWSLSGSTYTDVFPSDSSPVYSIVASTPNAINGSTQIGEFENPKYLQRTYECPEDEDPASCTDERWRNTMRTDLYLGGYKAEDELPDDNPTDEKMHNIRNIGSLIVGAEEQANIDGATSYGLYIAENIDNTETLPDGTLNPNAKSNAYIGGSLMAGLKKFFVSKDSLNYGPITRENEEHEEEIARYNFTVDSATGYMRQHGDLDIARDFYSNSLSHESYSNSTILMGAGDAYSYFVMKAQRYPIDSDNLGEKLIFMGSGNGGLVRIDSDINYDAFSEGDKIHGGQFNINYASRGKRGSVMVQRRHIEEGHEVVEEVEEVINNIDYKTNQKFPVAIGSNTYVQGLLAADQVDTQKLRTASFSTGSRHVDDAHQWLNVDKDGVVIESTEQNSNESNTTITKVNVNNSGVKMRYGGTDEAPEAILVLKSDTFSDDSSPTGSRTDYAIVGEADNITMKTENDGVLSLRNDMIEQAMMHTQIDFGFLDDSRWDGYSNYDVNFHTDGVVNLIGSNLRAGYEAAGAKHPVFSVNTQSNFADRSNVLPDASLNSSNNNYPADFSIAMHGNVLFTDDQSNGNTGAGYTTGHDHRYMSIGQATDTANINNAAGVEIVANATNSNTHKAVLIDVSAKVDNYSDVNTYNYVSGGMAAAKYKTDTDFTLDTGTVYIRKGGVDVIPDLPDASAAWISPKSATEANGFIAAGRFVANNRDSSGNLVKVPDMIKNEKYNAYNSKSKDGRYDTYMVNPAYTSVMHDIKLTTRGGARLSDILPNFIIKSIYLSTNDKDDTLNNFTFQHGSEGIKCGGDSCPVAGSNYWASPYTGYVPAPQCPPGYSRVLTFTPVSMYMAQAGQLAKAPFLPDDFAGNKFHVEEDLMAYLAEAYSGDGDQTKIKDIVPAYRRAKIRLGNEAAHTMKLSSSTDGISNSTFSVSEVYGLEAAGQGDSYSEVYPMVLTAGGKETTALPFVFQQNTWLKTLSVPMCAEKASTYAGGECEGKYVRSWALLLGFVYTQDIYNKYMANDSKRVAVKDTLYWNVFPITKGSLEGTATTYCYFNRSNMKTINESDDGSGFQAFRVNSATDHVEPEDDYKNYISEEKYLSLEDTNLPSGYQKPNSSYLKRLNDPTLKYTEEW